MLVSVGGHVCLCVAWKFGRQKLWGKLDVLFLDVFGWSSQHSMSPFASAGGQKETSCLKSSRGYFYPGNALAATGSWMLAMLASTLQMVHGGNKTKLINSVWNDSVLESVWMCPCWRQKELTRWGSSRFCAKWYSIILLCRCTGRLWSIFQQRLIEPKTKMPLLLMLWCDWIRKCYTGPLACLWWCTSVCKDIWKRVWISHWPQILNPSLFG